ncbi:nitrile hydratase subunit alpha [Hydrogenophaga sp. BPS33]|uniref:nitrile hydratase subunit alpha n=1 Tax=Hydrogenophaga sp. BPS33 TaxID=2651974 RepID=UPI00131FA650|nr:nitrile hydratase subunit alpha [Hydrogenophaga sp. BPS33]QHE84707.1 nitrile hydratase subunit alpha [Hydrogenophaga sp. BPS33]
MNQTHSGKATASLKDRARAVEAAMVDKGLLPQDYIDAFIHRSENDWHPRNGAQVVAKAWSEPSFREWLLADGKAACASLGYVGPAHQKRVVALENTVSEHHAVVCTLCSCTAWPVLGLAPDWYKDFEYRARVVRDARKVFREMGLLLESQIAIRIWDTTADSRYFVIPRRPDFSQGWDEAALAAIVTKESMIGVSSLLPEQQVMPEVR